MNIRNALKMEPLFLFTSRCDQKAVNKMVGGFEK